MNRFIACLIWILTAILLAVSVAAAADLYLEGTLSSGTHYSMGNIITQNNCTVNNGVVVTLQSEAVIKLGPTTTIISGGTLTVVNIDNDGLVNAWERQYFPDLSQTPAGDYDDNGLTNLDEYSLGLDPTDGVVDSDDDGIPDWWEVAYFGYDLSNDENYDDDGDGVIAGVEYKLGSNPAENDLPGPGVHYEYDALGRITKIYRIPKQ